MLGLQSSLSKKVVLRWVLLAAVFSMCMFCTNVCATPSDTGYEEIAEESFENFPLNVSLFRAVNDCHSPAADTFFQIVWFLGTGFFLAPIFAVVWFWRRDKTKVFVLTIAIETAIVQIIKQVTMQPRPLKMLPDVHTIAGLEQLNRSFPSGDVAMVFAVLAALWPGERLWLKIVLVSYGLLVAYERIYIGVHFPLDTFVGALIGVASGLIGWRIILRKRRCS